jgi:hypothetical protein
LEPCSPIDVKNLGVDKPLQPLVDVHLLTLHRTMGEGVRGLIKGTSVGKFSAPDRHLATYDVETGRAGRFERAEEKRLKKK